MESITRRVFFQPEQFKKALITYLNTRRGLLTIHDIILSNQGLLVVECFVGEPFNLKFRFQLEKIPTSDLWRLEQIILGLRSRLDKSEVVTSNNQTLVIRRKGIYNIQVSFNLVPNCYNYHLAFKDGSYERERSFTRCGDGRNDKGFYFEEFRVLGDIGYVRFFDPVNRGYSITAFPVNNEHKELGEYEKFGLTKEIHEETLLSSSEIENPDFIQLIDLILNLKILVQVLFVTFTSIFITTIVSLYMKRKE